MKDFVVSVLQSRSFDLRIKADTLSEAEAKAKDIVMNTDAVDYKTRADYSVLVKGKSCSSRQEKDENIVVFSRKEDVCF